MKRAWATCLLAYLCVTPGSLLAQAPAKTYRIGFLRAAPPPPSYLEAFKAGLAELGYVEGRNLVLEYRWAPERIDKLGELAAELVGMKVDVIVIDGMPAVLAAKAATRDIPIIMSGIGDPVATRVVESFKRPGGNVTGLTIMAAELSGKRLAVLKELLPAVARFGILTNPGNKAHEVLIAEAMAAAKNMGVELHVVAARSGAELDQAFAAMAAQRIGAFVVLPDQVLSSQRARIIQLAAQHRMPALYERKESVEEGGLISYGVSYQEMYRRSASYIDRVLKGAKPGDLSIEQPTRFEMVINAGTARTLGIAVPESLRVRADKIIP